MFLFFPDFLKNVQQYSNDPYFTSNQGNDATESQKEKKSQKE